MAKHLLVEVCIDDFWGKYGDDGEAIVDRYLCNSKIEPKKEKCVNKIDEVTCKNCIRIRKV
jgi:hypothetical protein